jgi:SNF2 family DNA or RNA helicase
VFSGFENFQPILFPTDHTSVADNKADKLRLVIIHYDKECGAVGAGDRLNFAIRTLNQISRDSKFEVFEEQLHDLIESGHRVIVFTQYLDTLDFIRSRLEHRFGDEIGCYSGRGGEVWDPIANSWKAVEKAEIKARSKRNHATPIRVLLGTDAASEGLSLQQFSALINYDLPWNPMRVEQRIGRIDRIGQQSERVFIVNLYVRDTIEEDAYDTLRNRIPCVRGRRRTAATDSG